MYPGAMHSGLPVFSGAGAYSASILNTSDAPRRKQLAYWKEYVCRTIAGVEATSLVRSPAYAGYISAKKLHVRDCRDVALLEVVADPQKVERTSGLIRDQGDGSWLVMLQAAGSCHFTQNGTENRLLPGDLGFLDTSRPYQVLFPQRFGQIIVKLPASLLKERLTGHDLAGAVLAGTEALTSLAASNLRLLTGLIDRIEPSLMPAVTGAALDYLILAAAVRFPARRQEPRHGPHQEPRHQTYDVHLARAKSFIADHLGDPLLSVSRIARALDLSESHLHEIFSSAGQTTIANHIREQRLLCASRDLADLRLADLPITAIAMKWGFSEASSFSRAFRNAYRTSPRAFRRSVRQGK
jgi:AraC-like DNA-binding protein